MLWLLSVKNGWMNTKIRGNMKKRFVEWLLCLCGKHEWEFKVWTTRGGIAIGDKCSRCGVWSKSAIRKPYPDLEEYGGMV